MFDVALLVSPVAPSSPFIHSLFLVFNMPGIRPQNLNDVFYAAANQARQKLPELSHNQKVARLYRDALKTLCSWAIDRDVFNQAATELRARFDANRGVSAAAASRLLREGQDELFRNMHPDIYKNPEMPGGSKFMRNPPPPIEVCFPDGNLPEDAPRYTVNPDWSIATSESGRNATGTVLVDFYKKNME